MRSNFFADFIHIAICLEFLVLVLKPLNQLTPRPVIPLLAMSGGSWFVRISGILTVGVNKRTEQKPGEQAELELRNCGKGFCFRRRAYNFPAFLFKWLREVFVCENGAYSFKYGLINILEAFCQVRFIVLL